MAKYDNYWKKKNRPDRSIEVRRLVIDNPEAFKAIHAASDLAEALLRDRPFDPKLKELERVIATLFATLEFRV